MKRATAPLVIAMIVMLAASACLVTLPVLAPAPPTFTPDLMSTGKAAQTLTALPSATYTSTIVPDTATPTVTLTSFPTITPLPTSTVTFTPTPFGFVASPTIDLTLSGTETPDPAEGATDDWGSDYRCTLVDKEPADWTTFHSKALYKGSWTLYNSGKKKWDAGNITLIYIEGPKFSDTKAVNLNKDVKVNSSIKTYITLFTPSSPGKYRMVWGMQVNKTGHVFCTFTLKVTIE